MSVCINFSLDGVIFDLVWHRPLIERRLHCDYFRFRRSYVTSLTSQGPAIIPFSISVLNLSVSEEASLFVCLCSCCEQERVSILDLRTTIPDGCLLTMVCPDLVERGSLGDFVVEGICRL